MKVADSLEVDTDGLRSAANDSLGVADALGGYVAAAASGDQRSHAGVAALDAAVSIVRRRQSTRTGQQASGLSAAGTRYDDSDDDAGRALTVSM
jgi:hypothetical protein